jgi:hypothetical protein
MPLFYFPFTRFLVQEDYFDRGPRGQGAEQRKELSRVRSWRGMGLWAAGTCSWDFFGTFAASPELFKANLAEQTFLHQPARSRIIRAGELLWHNLAIAHRVSSDLHFWRFCARFGPGMAFSLALRTRSRLEEVEKVFLLQGTMSLSAESLLQASNAPQQRTTTR